MKKKIVEINISSVYGDIQIQRGENKRTYNYTRKAEHNIQKLTKFVGNFASSQVYIPKKG